jgi:hypothetical protein
MNELDRELKKYRLDSLLILIAEQSRELFRERIAYKEVQWGRLVGGLTQRFRQFLTAWSLADLSLAAIRVSNDYRSAEPTTVTVFRLNNLLAKIGDEEAKINTENIRVEDMKIHLLFGLTQKQFWY